MYSKQKFCNRAAKTKPRRQTKQRGCSVATEEAGFHEPVGTFNNEISLHSLELGASVPFRLKT